MDKKEFKDTLRKIDSLKTEIYYYTNNFSRNLEYELGENLNKNLKFEIRDFNTEINSLIEELYSEIEVLVSIIKNSQIEIEDFKKKVAPKVLVDLL